MTDKIVVVPGNPSVIKVIAGGPIGERGPGIESNITRITASVTPPSNPEVNDLWVDLS